jgi:hypothetical protein
MCCSKKILRKEVLTNGMESITLTDLGDGKIHLERVTSKIIKSNKLIPNTGTTCITTEYLEAEGQWSDRYDLNYVYPNEDKTSNKELDENPDVLNEKDPEMPEDNE